MMKIQHKISSIYKQNKLKIGHAKKSNNTYNKIRREKIATGDESFIRLCRIVWYLSQETTKRERERERERGGTKQVGN